MNNILITLKKELRSILRDKKTLAALFVYPLMIPFFIVLYGVVGDQTENETVTETIGINYTLSEVEKAIMKELNIEYIYYDDLSDLEQAYDNDEINGYITKKDTTYKIYADSSNTNGLISAEIMYSYLEYYSLYLTDEYLINHNIDINEAKNHFTIEEEDLASNNYMIVLTISMAITYCILSIAICTTNMSIQATATEKENGTLETILTFPIKKTELILGKYFSSVITGFIASVVSLILMLISLYISKLKFTTFETIDLSINAATIFGCLITVLSASIFIGGVSLLLTAFAKSYKEAQSKANFVTMISMIPMFVSLLEIEISPTYYLIPVCNFTQILNDLLLNNIGLGNILITASSTIIYTIIVITIIIKAYNSEKILFTD